MDDLKAELAAIRERSSVARMRAAEDEADLARRPTRLMSQSQFDRRLLARDNTRLLAALEAVVEVAAEWDRMWHACPEGCCGSPEATALREAITAALTETKGDGRG